MSFVFPPPPTRAVAIVGRSERFPVHRIYCVGRNYATRAREMGKVPSASLSPAGVAATRARARLEGGVTGLETSRVTLARHFTAGRHATL